jgi:hypothetical protein
MYTDKEGDVQDLGFGRADDKPACLWRSTEASIQLTAQVRNILLQSGFIAVAYLHVYPDVCLDNKVHFACPYVLLCHCDNILLHLVFFEPEIRLSPSLSNTYLTLQHDSNAGF